MGHYFGPFNPVEAGNFAQLKDQEELSEGQVEVSRGPYDSERAFLITPAQTALWDK